MNIEKDSLVPVGWFRMAMASQVMLEWMMGMFLFMLLQGASVWISATTGVGRDTPVQDWLKIHEFVYLGLGFIMLVSAAFFAKPPTEDEFSGTKWWQPWVLTQAKPPKARPRRNTSDDDDDDGPSPAEFNPGTGSLMVEGTMMDYDGHGIGETES